MNRNLPDGFDVKAFSKHFGDDVEEDAYPEGYADLSRIESCIACNGMGVFEDGDGEMSICPDCNGKELIDGQGALRSDARNTHETH